MVWGVRRRCGVCSGSRSPETGTATASRWPPSRSPRTRLSRPTRDDFRDFRPTTDASRPPSRISRTARNPRAAANTAKRRRTRGIARAVGGAVHSSASSRSARAGNAPRAAAVNTACCDGPFGAVSDADRTVLVHRRDTIVVDDARITAAAGDTRRSDARPQCGRRPQRHRPPRLPFAPSASASSVLHRPSGASIPAAANMLVACGASVERRRPGDGADGDSSPNPDPGADPDPATASRRDVRGDERRRTRGVDRETRASEPERVRDGRTRRRRRFPRRGTRAWGAPVSSGTTRE